MTDDTNHNKKGIWESIKPGIPNIDIREIGISLVSKNMPKVK